MHRHVSWREDACFVAAWWSSVHPYITCCIYKGEGRVDPFDYFLPEPINEFFYSHSVIIDTITHNSIPHKRSLAWPSHNVTKTTNHASLAPISS